MFDSLAYRNDAAVVMRRLIRSLPTRKGVIGVATCDKGLPAMMIALAGMQGTSRRRRAGRRHTPRRRGERTRAGFRASVLASRTVKSRSKRRRSWAAAPAPPPAAAVNSWARPPRRKWSRRRWAWRCPTRRSRLPGKRFGSTSARRSARAAGAPGERGITLGDILTEGAIQNAMAVHAAFGGSTNLLLHIPAIAHAAGLRRPTVRDWQAINRRVPRLVDALPNGPHGPSHRAGLPGRRRSRGDAAPAPPGLIDGSV